MAKWRIKNVSGGGLGELKHGLLGSPCAGVVSRASDADRTPAG